MGKRRGLGIKRAYNKYVAPYTAPSLEVGMSDYKNTKRLLTDEIPPEILDKIPDSWRGNMKEPDPQPDARGNSINSRAIGFGTSSAHHSRLVVRCPSQRGMGYQAPGPTFAKTFGKVKTQFSFEMTTPINFRNYGRMVFRSLGGFQHRTPWTTNLLPATGNRPTDPGSCTLAPTLRQRTVNGYTVNTATRDIGLYKPDATTFAMTRVTKDKDDLALTQITLAELEIASWNANPFKYVPWNSFNAMSTALESAGGASATSLQVFKDWVPPLVATAETTATSAATADVYASPFDTIPFESETVGGSVVNSVQVGGFTRKFENYMCHLGPGTITLHFQNRVNTACDVDIVVYQLKSSTAGGLASIQAGTESTSLPNILEQQLKAAYVAKHNSGTSASNSGYGGEDIVGDDILTNPTKPFLAESKKFLERPALMKRVSSERFRIAGGGVKPTTIVLPEVCYDPYVHSRWAQYGTIVTPSTLSSVGVPNLTAPREWLQPHSYVIYVALQGVLMPAFGATTTVAGGSVLATTGTLPIDTLTCPASILVHGEYTERPLPCKSVSPTTILQQKPELRDVSMVATTGKLISGYVGDPPVVTTTNTIIQNGA